MASVIFRDEQTFNEDDEKPLRLSLAVDAAGLITYTRPMGLTDRNPLTRRARRLRSEMTEAEALLWYHLRRRQVSNARFRRQVPLGQYIADFVCHHAKLVVEVDGAQHAGSSYDEVRDRWLETQGFTVLRFWNDEVLRDVEQVVWEISGYLVDAAS